MITNLHVGGKDYTIKYNLGFTRYVDDLYANPELKGVSMGINQLITQLEFFSPEALVAFIKAGTATEDQKPQTREIEEFIESQDDLMWLFDGAKEGLKKSPLTRGQTEMAIERMDQAKAIQQRQLESL